MTALYGIYDSKAETYLPLMEASNHHHAIRTVADAIAQGAKQLAQHPDDYTLFMICSYDPVTGFITQDKQPERVASLSAIIDMYFKQTEGEAGGASPLPNGSDPSEDFPSVSDTGGAEDGAGDAAPDEAP